MIINNNLTVTLLIKYNVLHLLLRLACFNLAYIILRIIRSLFLRNDSLLSMIHLPFSTLKFIFCLLLVINDLDRFKIKKLKTSASASKSQNTLAVFIKFLNHNMGNLILVQSILKHKLE